MTKNKKQHIAMILAIAVLVVGVTSYFITNQKDNQSVLAAQYVDNQHFIADMPRIQLSPEGVYYFQNSMLYYYDNNAQVAVPLCNQSDCRHTMYLSTCNAYFNNSMEQIWYSDEQIYVVAAEDDFSNTYYLYEVSGDGSSRKKTAELFTIGEFGVSYSMIVHRGYAYYSIDALSPDLETVTLYRAKLGSTKKPEVISEMEVYKGYYASLKAEGDYLYYTKYIKSMETEEVESNMLYRYDLNTNQEICMETEIKQFSVKEDTIYYMDTDGLYEYEVETRESQLIYTFPETHTLPVMNFDGTNFYLDNYFTIFLNDEDFSKREILVVNTKGEWIDSIPLEENKQPFFGDEAALYIEETMETGQQILQRLDKTTIGTGVHEWKTLIAINTEED